LLGAGVALTVAMEYLHRHDNGSTLNRKIKTFSEIGKNISTKIIKPKGISIDKTCTVLDVPSQVGAKSEKLTFTVVSATMSTYSMPVSMKMRPTRMLWRSQAMAKGIQRLKPTG
jgi:hypothetical protein